MHPPMVAARHFEDALASAKQTAQLAAARQQSSFAAAQRPRQAARHVGEDMDVEDGPAGGIASAPGNAGHATDGRQAAWISAAAARAADDVRKQMAASGAGDFAGAETARLVAYVQQLETTLLSAGIPLPARTA